LVRDHWRLAWAGLLGAALILSILLFLLTPRALRAEVLFFPTATNHGLASEEHFLPVSKNPAERARRLVEAALAGPLSLKFKRLAPPQSRVLALYYREGRLYADLSASFQESRDDCPLDPAVRLSVLSQAIRYNLPEVAEVVYFIEGKEVARRF
jgi:hypothetical protein